VTQVSPEALNAIRNGLRGLPDLAHHVSGTPVAPEQIFFPPGHGDALDPDKALVVGNRGVGKSFWASALAEDASRFAIAAAYRGNRSQGAFDGLIVRFGFSGAEAGGNAPIGKTHIDSVGPDIPASLLWRAVVVRCLELILHQETNPTLADFIAWIRDNPDAQQSWFRDADRYLNAQGKRVLILFDQLEQMTNEWTRINELTKGLLQTALAMKSYKSIRLKIFMRQDQFEHSSPFQFPDGAKIRGEAVRLLWRSTDLYALLFFELARSPVSTEIFQWARHPSDWIASEDIQRTFFEIIAGPFMGSDKRRGTPYTWIPTHLSDARGEISPRSFLKALKTAAQLEPAPAASAIDYRGIHEGVRAASDNRLAELQEDYPWISQPLDPLRGTQVPASKEDVFNRWRSADIDQVAAGWFQGNDDPLETLLKVLQAIGVMDLRKNGKIDVPDIFRVRAGILRRGGVPPHRRRVI
jgi:hypothetical protein